VLTVLWIVSTCFTLYGTAQQQKTPPPLSKKTEPTQMSNPVGTGGTPTVQSNAPLSEPPANQQVVQNARPTAKHFLTDLEFWLSLEVLVFGGAVVFLEFLLLRGRSITAEEALRVYAITIIIIGALFTVTAGFDNISVAPAFGLLGTVAGYILGRRVAPPESPPTQGRTNE